jgi:hypothetical protein
MKSDINKSAFFACPQCKYQYRYARTRVSGLATNPGQFTQKCVTYVP